MKWQSQQDISNDLLVRRALNRVDTNGILVAAAVVPTGATVGYNDAYALPPGWLRCDGKLYQTSDLPALGRLISGGTTFVVPTSPDSIIKT